MDLDQFPAVCCLLRRSDQSIKRLRCQSWGNQLNVGLADGGSTNQESTLGLASTSVRMSNGSMSGIQSDFRTAFRPKRMKEDIPITTQQYPNGTGEFVKHSIRLDYLSFGILPKVRFETGVAEVYGIAGLRVDISLSNNVAVEGREPLRTQSPNHFNTRRQVQESRSRRNVGIGVQSDSLLPLPVGIEVRYSPNFQNGYSTSIWTIRNTSFEFLLIVSM